MGAFKEEQLRQDDLHQVALDIHRRAGNVKNALDEVPCDCLRGDMDSAYAIGSAMHRDGDSIVSHYTRVELMDAIKNTLSQLPALGEYEKGLLRD